ncbi:hypothetical protein TURU_138225 [Turdus rufiventris]|nr:hypothetical protein TURU_138225 [Turdus rufiventris]
MAKCKIVLLSQSNPKHRGTLDRDYIENSPEEKDVGIFFGLSTDEKLNKSHQCELTAQKANSVLDCFKRISPAVLSALLGLTILKGWEVFKRIQRRATKVVKVVEGKSCEEQLRTLSLSNLEKRKLRCNYIALFSFLRGGSGEGGKIFREYLNKEAASRVETEIK